MVVFDVVFMFWTLLGWKCNTNNNISQNLNLSNIKIINIKQDLEDLDVMTLHLMYS